MAWNVRILVVAASMAIGVCLPAGAAENPFGSEFLEYAPSPEVEDEPLSGEIWEGTLGKAIVRFEFWTDIPENDGDTVIRREIGYVTSYSDPEDTVVDRCRWEGKLSSSADGFELNAPKAGCWRTSNDQPGENVYEDIGSTSGRSFDCVYTDPEKSLARCAIEDLDTGERQSMEIYADNGEY